MLLSLVSENYAESLEEFAQKFNVGLFSSNSSLWLSHLFSAFLPAWARQPLDGHEEQRPLPPVLMCHRGNWTRFLLPIEER